MYRQNAYRRRRHFITPTCPTHKGVALKLGRCPTCEKIKADEREAKVKAMPDVRQYNNWEGVVKFWSPSFQPLYMILLDRVPEGVHPDGSKRVFQFGFSALAGSHARTIEEVRKAAQDMLRKFDYMNWSEVTVKIVNAPCVFDATIIHEVIETVATTEPRF